MEAPCRKHLDSHGRIGLICFVSITCATLYINLAVGIISSDLDVHNKPIRFAPSPDEAIAFRFHPASPGEGPLRNASMGGSYRCSAELSNAKNGIHRTDILPSALQEPGLFDFATTVKSTKRVLFIGDSVAQQLSEAFDESLGIISSWYRQTGEVDESIGHRKGFDGYKDGNKETISFSYPTNGGGASAYWRMTDIWTSMNKGKPLPPHVGGGWNQHQIKVLRNQLMNRFKNTEFDAVIMNYNNWVWPDVEELEIRYREAIHLTRTAFNATAIILVTYPFTKTVNSTKRWTDVHEYNNMLRRISTENDQNSSNDVSIMVLEFGNFANQLLWTNARSIGIEMSDPRTVSSVHGWELRDNVTTRFTNSPVCPISATVGKLCLHMPSICAEYADENTKCLRNFISYDDMHWCTETIGARWSAGIACLLGCALNKCEGQVKTEASRSLCQNRCNEQFMSLNRIKQEWADDASWFSSCQHV